MPYVRLGKYVNISAKMIVRNLFMLSLHQSWTVAIVFSMDFLLHLDNLQRIQNAAARLVSRSKKYEHITPALPDLHWLNVKNRITFKILLITFKALHGQAPIYINELLNIYRPTRLLRSAGRNLLQVPTFYTKTYEDRAFSVAVAKLWNSLPDAIRIIESLDILKPI